MPLRRIRRFKTSSKNLAHYTRYCCAYITACKFDVIIYIHSPIRLSVPKINTLFLVDTKTKQKIEALRERKYPLRQEIDWVLHSISIVYTVLTLLDVYTRICIVLLFGTAARAPLACTIRCAPQVLTYRSNERTWELYLTSENSRRPCHQSSFF